MDNKTDEVLFTWRGVPVTRSNLTIGLAVQIIQYLAATLETERKIGRLSAELCAVSGEPSEG